MPSRQFVATLILVFNLATLAFMSRSYFKDFTRVEPSYYGHDAPEMLPISQPTDSVLMTVEESVRYPVIGEDSDSEWFSLTSAGYGYVHLGPDRRTFMVTMFHELHCLRLLNLALGRSKTANIAHARHCLGYLRQFILCSADLTLEPGNFEEKDYSRDRVGATHVCNDWSAVYPYMLDNWYDWNSYKANNNTSP